MPLRHLPLQQFYQGRILNFAHRGVNRRAPENTMVAFRLAADESYDGIEFDVQLTADNEVIVFHDNTLERVAGDPRKISELRALDATHMDVGSWFSADFSGETIPRLAEVLDQFGKRLLLNIEMKGENPLLASKTVDLVQSFDLESRVIISSFNETLLKEVRRFDPQIAIGRLLHQESVLGRSAEALIRDLTIRKTQAYHLHHSNVDEKTIRWAHRRSRRVNVWTVNERADIVRMRDMGVDMIISDAPDVVQAVLRGEL